MLFTTNQSSALHPVLAFDAKVVKSRTLIDTRAESSALHPVLVFDAKVVKSRTLIDTGAESSSLKKSDKQVKKIIRKECERLATLLHSVVEKVKIHNLEIQDIN